MHTSPLTHALTSLHSLSLPRYSAAQQKDPPDYFTDLWNDLFNKKISEEERMPLNFIFKQYQEGLHAAKRNEINLSAFHFQYASRQVTAIQPKKVYRRYLDVTGLPAKAYLYYKKNKHDKAMQLLHQALQNDIVLEAEGFHFLTLHRIQQYHNICRIYVTQHKIPAAITLAGHVISYMIDDQFPFQDLQPGMIDIEKEETSYLRSAMIVQIFTELYGIALTAKINDGEEQALRLFKLSFEHIVNFRIKSAEDEVIYDYYQALSTYYQEDYQQFLPIAHQFIAERDQRYDKLKFFLLIHISEVLKKNALHKNDTVTQNVILSLVTHLKISSGQRLFFTNRYTPAG